MGKGYCPVFGNYPKEYNRAVHGPYYPWVNYSPIKDTHLSEVKLGDLKNWLGRRNWTPQAIITASSRQYFKWHVNYFNSRFGSPSKGLFQTLVVMSFLSMLSTYGYLKTHRHHKYHW